MNILSTGIQQLLPAQPLTERPKTEDANGAGFGEFLKDAVNQVNELQGQSSDMKTKLVTGDIQDLHQVMIAAEKLAWPLILQFK